ncbi:sulfotransferase domain-containing protein [Aliarcobacter butzleri]|uniref:sulfotransferase domain-containing protein n=1 Tax=Aliarcobacter butzleri TaxID=28197 RepID=UPI003AF76D8D
MIMIDNKTIQYTSVSGYGWTGSSVVVDLLKEFETFGTLDFEFSMVWEPNGIIDLEKSLVDSWDFLRHDIAIRDFIKYCKLLDSKSSKFNSLGLDMSKHLHIDFLLESIKYVENLTDIKYSGYTRLFDYEYSQIALIYRKILRKFFKRILSNNEMYLARPSKEKFIKETRNYFDRIFSNYCDKNHINTVLLDQALPVAGITKSIDYFSNIKAIVVDRDPRDIYVDLINHNALIGIECKKETRESTKNYIRWHNILRQNRSELSKLEEEGKVLCFKFEDIVLEYDKSINQICKFLNLDLQKHILRNKYFKPELSSKNIGMWKTHSNQEEIDYIYGELKEYCYEI